MNLKEIFDEELTRAKVEAANLAFEQMTWPIGLSFGHTPELSALESLPWTLALTVAAHDS